MCCCDSAMLGSRLHAKQLMHIMTPLLEVQKGGIISNPTSFKIEEVHLDPYYPFSSKIQFAHHTCVRRIHP